jgi:hypothetical protein
VISQLISEDLLEMVLKFTSDTIINCIVLFTQVKNILSYLLVHVVCGTPDCVRSSLSMLSVMSVLLFFQKSSRSASQNVIEIPDSPPTLDLSVEQGDFGLSNIISMTSEQGAQPMEQDSQLGALSHLASNTSAALSDFSSRLASTTAQIRDTSQSWQSSPSKGPGSSTPTKVSDSMFGSNVTPTKSSDSLFGDAVPSSSDVFFPLSVSHDSKSGIDTSVGAMLTDDYKNQFSQSGQMPGTPGSGTSDSNQGPVPISGPIPSSSSMSPGGCGLEGGGEGKVGIKLDLFILFMSSTVLGVFGQILQEIGYPKLSYFANERMYQFI